MRFSFNPLAERELNDAAHYYEHESTGLGAAFLDDVEQSCRAIGEFPEAAPVAVGAVRRRILRRFPYAVLYSIQEQQIRILAVMNLKRRPGYWIGRD
jgi:plasmid stabilization system protein ParE